MTAHLTDRVVVISGATGGLGRVVARRFARGGARLALLGRRAQALEDLRAELGLSEARCLIRAVDLLDAPAVRETAAAVQTGPGRAQVLLHLVGGWSGGTPVAELPADEVRAMLDQHLWSTLHLLQAFLPHLAAGGWGRIIAVSSPFAGQPRRNGGPYAVGKAAQESLILTLAQELRGTGVTANLLLVRAIDTEHARDREQSPKNQTWTTPEEIAAAMLYLCSEEGGVVNGARLPLHPLPAG